MDAVVTFYEEARKILDKGISLARLLELTVREDIARLRELARSVDELSSDPTVVPKSPRAQAIEAVKVGVRRLVSRVPIGAFAPVFDELRHQIAQLKRRT